jgi:hypothetical protein
LLALIAEEEARLEERLTTLLEREEAQAAERLGFEDTIEGERLRRYQMTCNRTLLRIIETLRKRRREAGTSAAKPTKAARGRAAAPAGAGPAQPVDDASKEDLDDGAGHDDGGVGAFVPAATENLTNEADGPDPSRPADGEPLSLTPQTATNEANGPVETSVRPTVSLASAFLALLVVLVFAGLATALGASLEIIGSHSVPRRDGDAGKTAKSQENQSLRRLVQVASCLEASDRDVIHPSSLGLSVPVIREVRACPRDLTGRHREEFRDVRGTPNVEPGPAVTPTSRPGSTRTVL